MGKLMTFSTRVQGLFENNAENLEAFQKLVMNASNGIYNEYSKEETNEILRTMFDKVMGITPEMNAMKRRQQYRLHDKEWFSIVEDVMVDKLVSGWGDDPFFNQFVDTRNLALGDKNEFFVEENSLLQVSKFAGNHHDIVRTKVGFGKAFSVETSWYGIKVYNDYELFRAGKIDFAAQINKMYESIIKFRKDAIYAAFMSGHEALPTDLVVDITLSKETVDDVIALVEEVRACTGKDVCIIGTKVATQKLAKCVDYSIWSNDMKQTLHTTGELGLFEGIQLISIPRVNEINSRKEVTDNTKLFIMPIDPENKFIKNVVEGDVIYTESGMNGERRDMTIDAEIMYKEGISVVINQLYGVINLN